MSRTDATFATISSAGGLLPTDLLARLSDDPGSLPGTGSTDYGLIETKKVKSAINEAWNDLLGQWAKFRTHVPPPSDRDDDARYLSDTRTMWLLPLFQTLGWGKLQQATPGQQLELDTTTATGLVADGRRFPLTHELDGVVPVHLLGAGVPLDRRTKAIRGAADQSPHSMLQELLNVSDRHLWAVSSNGEQLRILRDTTSLTRQAYVEFDLATMFDNQVFSDFAVLWLICHRTRFPQPDAPSDCWLEQWQNLAAEQGVRALDDLRDGVAAAIEALATGLIDHPANEALRSGIRNGEVEGADLYRQVLRTIYRMMFLLVIEDRRLLHTPNTADDLRDRYARHYSMDRLRTQARNHLGGRHGDGWQQWQTLAGRLGSPQGIPQLGVPSLAGGLFARDATPLLDRTDVTNRHLYEAVRRLAFVQRESALHRIDFRNLGSEELGSVYESLLELQPAVDLTARTFALGAVAGNERQTTGSYYTPTSLIKVLLDEALDPVIDQVVADAEAGSQDVEEAILSITVCDPAMGSAHFLVGAAFRLAKRLAQIRTQEAEPSPEQIQQALRDVVSHCLYGVDVNPMAVELAKVSLWLECHVPGQPLTFLDHHLKQGNALLGVGFETSLLRWNQHASGAGAQGGVPDAAFNPLTGDDKQHARLLRDRNRARRTAGGHVRFGETEDHADDKAALVAVAKRIAWLDDDTPAALEAKANAWMAYGHHDEYVRLKLRADAWTACWTMPKTEDATEGLLATSEIADDDLPADIYYDTHFNGVPADTRPGVRFVRDEASKLSFFHWFVEYPDVAEAGGFDVMLGNPPWEVLAMEEPSWFAARGRPDIAGAKNSNARKKMIATLTEGETSPVDRALAQAFRHATRDIEAVKEFCSRSGRYAYGAAGSVDLYGLFTDHAWRSKGPLGRVGMVIKDGLAVGARFAPFFRHLVDHGELKCFYSFENEGLIFPGITNKIKFALVVLGRPAPDEPIAFVGYARHPDAINDPDRRYELDADDIRAINPNTRTAPLFRLAASAQVTAAVHRGVPALMDDTLPPGDANKNPWGARFLPLFNMSDDSDKFLEREDLEALDAAFDGNIAVAPDGTRYVPLYEGKMLWHYDHRYGTYAGQTEKQANKGVLPHTPSTDKADPSFVPMPRYWLPAATAAAEFRDKDWNREWVIPFRDTGPAERTFVAAVTPRYPTARNNAPIIVPEGGPPAVFLAALSSLVIDFAMRQKSTRPSLFVIEQLPVVGPATAARSCPWPSSETIEEFVTQRIAELTYTAHDLSGWAADIGYAGNPFRWDDDRRTVLQAELDGLMFLLYGLDRDQTEFVLDSFEVLRKYEEKAPEKGGYGEFRTKRLVLERFDAMAKAIEADEPYQCPLPEPPAATSQRHDPTAPRLSRPV